MSENNNIKIGNNNKINKSKIGNFKNTKDKDSSISKFSGCILKILAGIITSVAATFIGHWLLQLFNLL